MAEAPAEPTPALSAARRAGVLTRQLAPPAKPEATPRAGKPGSEPAQRGSIRPSGLPEGTEYTWQDGDQARRVWLQNDLAVEKSGVSADGEGVAWGDDETIVEKQGRHKGASSPPVFRSSSGGLMTLPGGVLLALDRDWDQTRINAFFATHGIEMSRVETRAFTINAFFITTEPGFPSLNLANTLSSQDGVVLASPNWQTEAVAR